jgi:hypothetical protein
MISTVHVHATDIAGYAYRAEAYCPGCTLLALGLAPTAYVEGALDDEAARLGIERHDEHSFDSGDFPKVIFADEIHGDACGNCHGAL